MGPHGRGDSSDGVSGSDSGPEEQFKRAAAPPDARLQRRMRAMEAAEDSGGGATSSGEGAYGSGASNSGDEDASGGSEGPSEDGMSSSEEEDAVVRPDVNPATMPAAGLWRGAAGLVALNCSIVAIVLPRIASVLGGTAAKGTGTIICSYLAVTPTQHAFGTSGFCSQGCYPA